MTPRDAEHTYWFTTFPAPARWTTQGRFEPWTWAEIVHHLRTPELWPGAESIAASEDQLPAWSFARYADDCRVASEDARHAERETSARVLEVHGLRVEYIDDPAVDPDHLRQWWGRWQFLAYTTAYHQRPIGEKPSGPRWRVLIPFSRPVSLAEARKVATWAQSPHRAAGIVDDLTLDPWRHQAVPAVVPGGYRWEVNQGDLLDPALALGELADWEREDRTAAARLALIHTSVGDAGRAWLRGFARHDDTPWIDSLTPETGLVAPGRLLPAPRRAAGPGWPWLGSVAGGLWPGRVVAVIGPSSAACTSYALQMAEAVARLGGPVLYAPSVLGAEEIVARLLALRAHASVEHAMVLSRSVDPSDAVAAVEALAHDLPHLHLWTRPRQERTPESLATAAVAMAQGHAGRPPVVVVDAMPLPSAGPEWWATLTDIARPGGLTPEWPGAAVIVVCALPSGAAQAFASPDALVGWVRHAASRATATLELDPTLAELAKQAGLVLGVTFDPTPKREGRAAAVAVLANRHGDQAVIPFCYHPDTGWWEELGHAVPEEVPSTPLLLAGPVGA